VESRVVPDAQPVVLRVKRSRKTGIIKSAEVVGVSDQHHDFINLANFIYRPGPLDPDAQIPASPGLCGSVMDRMSAAMNTLLHRGKPPVDVQTARRVSDFMSCTALERVAKLAEPNTLAFLDPP
jgi:hypothetical protein